MTSHGQKRTRTAADDISDGSDTRINENTTMQTTTQIDTSASASAARSRMQAPAASDQPTHPSVRRQNIAHQNAQIDAAAANRQQNNPNGFYSAGVQLVGRHCAPNDPCIIGFHSEDAAEHLKLWPLAYRVAQIEVAEGSVAHAGKHLLMAKMGELSRIQCTECAGWGHYQSICPTYVRIQKLTTGIKECKSIMNNARQRGHIASQTGNCLGNKEGLKMI